MIALKIGTTSWRQATALAADEVEFTGTWVYAPNSLISLMVWDAGLNNARPMTQPEIDALPAQQLAAAHPALVAQLSSATAADYTRLLRAFVLITLDEINLLRGVIIGTGSLVFDPANMANATGVTSANITVTGAAFGDFVDVAAPYTLAGIIATGYVSAANTVVIRLHNGTGGAVNLGSGTWTVVVRRQPAMPQRTKAQLINAMTNRINAGDADT